MNYNELAYDEDGQREPVVMNDERRQSKTSHPNITERLPVVDKKRKRVTFESNERLPRGVEAQAPRTKEATQEEVAERWAEALPEGMDWPVAVAITQSTAMRIPSGAIFYGDEASSPKKQHWPVRSANRNLLLHWRLQRSHDVAEPREFEELWKLSSEESSEDERRLRRPSMSED